MKSSTQCKFCLNLIASDGVEDPAKALTVLHEKSYIRCGLSFCRSSSIIIRSMTMDTPCWCMWLRRPAAVWKLEGRYSSSCKPQASMNIHCATLFFCLIPSLTHVQSHKYLLAWIMRVVSMVYAPLEVHIYALTLSSRRGGVSFLYSKISLPFPHHL